MKVLSVPPFGIALRMKWYQAHIFEWEWLTHSHLNLTIIPRYWFYETHFHGRKLMLDDRPKILRFNSALTSSKLHDPSLPKHWLACVIVLPWRLAIPSCLPPWPEINLKQPRHLLIKKRCSLPCPSLVRVPLRGPNFCNHKRWRLIQILTPFFQCFPGIRNCYVLSSLHQMSYL